MRASVRLCVARAVAGVVQLAAGVTKALFAVSAHPLVPGTLRHGSLQAICALALLSNTPTATTVISPGPVTPQGSPHFGMRQVGRLPRWLCPRLCCRACFDSSPGHCVYHSVVCWMRDHVWCTHNARRHAMIDVQGILSPVSVASVSSPWSETTADVDKLVSSGALAALLSVMGDSAASNSMNNVGTDIHVFRASGGTLVCVRVAVHHAASVCTCAALVFSCLRLTLCCVRSRLQRTMPTP